MALSAATVWEIRPGVGSVNNGGGFVTGATGSDYSTQTSPQYALTGVTSSGAGDTVLSASAAADMVGNIAKAVSGTNITVGWFQVASVVVGVSITFSTNGAGASICTGVAASGVINIGGATNSIDSIFNIFIAGNTVWIKKGNDALTTNRTLSVGTVAAPILIRGYNSSRGDLDDPASGGTWVATHTANGFLDTTNFPVLSLNSGQLTVGTYTTFSTIRTTNSLTTSGTSLTCGTAKGANFFRVRVECTGATGNHAAIQVGGSFCLDCEFAVAGAGTAFTVIVGNADVAFEACRISSVSGGGITAASNARNTFVRCLFYSIVSGQVAIAVINPNNVVLIDGCTFDTVDTCLTLANTAVSDVYVRVTNNQVTNCGTFCNNLRSGTTRVPIAAFNNRIRNTTTTYTGFSNIADNGVAPGDITTSQTDANEYVGQSSSPPNLRLKAAAVGIGQGLPYGTSPGAWQRYAAIPAATDVRSGTTYGQDNTTLNTFDERTGTLAVPSAANVLFGVSVDNTTGTYVTVATTDVRSGVTFGAGSVSTGVLVLPVTTDVKNGVMYGANGTEFTGSLASGGGNNLPLGG